MHQTNKDNEWKYGMKCHIGVDAGSGLVHTITVNAANDHDIAQETALIREDDEVVYGDSGYLGIQKRPERTKDTHLSSIDYRINRRPRKLPHVSYNAIDWKRYIENCKSSVHCKVEHSLWVIKCQFGYKKTAYHGLRKNENRLYAMFACANLYATAIVVLLVVYENKSLYYLGYLIYVMAIYAFWNAATAIYDAVCIHRTSEHVLAAAKTLQQAVALVSILSEQHTAAD